MIGLVPAFLYLLVADIFSTSDYSGFEYLSYVPLKYLSLMAYVIGGIPAMAVGMVAVWQLHRFGRSDVFLNQIVALFVISVLTTYTLMFIEYINGWQNLFIFICGQAIFATAILWWIERRWVAAALTESRR